jgi:hypothetical protein
MTPMISSRKNKLLARALLAALLSLAAAAHSWAGLTWDKTKIEVTAEVGAPRVHVQYVFTNTGTAAISITSITPSCNCVAPRLAKTDYAPGESGTLKAIYNVLRDKPAPVVFRTISVVTSDSPSSPTLLQLWVHIPVGVTTTPEELYWQHGQKPTSKDVIVQAGPGIKGMQLVQSGTNDNWTVNVTPEVKGERYRLTFTPKDIAGPSVAHLTFVVESPSIKHRVVTEILAHVM